MLAQYIREKGVREGEIKGEIKGERKGEIKGDKKRLISIVHSAHKEGLPLSMISKIVHLDISMVNSILNNEEIDIPLHLLDTNTSR